MTKQKKKKKKKKNYKNDWSQSSVPKRQLWLQGKKLSKNQCFLEYSFSFPYIMTGVLVSDCWRLTHKSRSTDRKIDFGVCPIIDLRARPSMVSENGHNP